MTAKDKYKDQDGGLYGGGQNVPPESHQKAADAELAKIVPLDAEGKPSPDGKIVLLSIGMSNTTAEYQAFKKLADADTDRNPQMTIVDGAQGGADAIAWSGRWGNFRAWVGADKRLEAAGVTAKQVQAVWIRQAIASPAAKGEFPKHAEVLRDALVSILNIARERYPNLRVAYVSSRIHAGYATTRLNPEPYACEGAFAVRRMIAEQVKDEPKLNYDPARGEVKAPFVLWGPYLWGDGMTPRKSDGLVWERKDLAQDGTHPSPTGRQKVAELLLKFFKSNRNAKTWFLRQASTAK